MRLCNTYLCQVNNRFGDQVFLPYSAGLLQAYCQQHELIRRHFTFKGFIYLREDIDRLVAGLDNPDIVGISCYVWNWQYSKRLAEAVKQSYPGCLIVMGGPQVPGRSEDFFRQHPYVDLLVHNEGEVAFSEILREFLQDSPDYTRIAGLSVKLDGNRCRKTPPGDRVMNLSQLPSPYLSGTFDRLIGLPHRWNACHETNRGCPYSCAFCDWGSAVFSRLRTFDLARLHRELEWFASHGVEILYNCDANYGILERDCDLTDKLAEFKRRHGFPSQFRPAFAKNSNHRVFRIAKVLQESGLQKGITLSMQSMNERCLEAVKRRNIPVDDLARLLKAYHREGIPTYTELIIGLPGETYRSFCEGIRRVFEAGQHQGCYIYMCELLPNAQMASPEYRSKHGIRTARMPILLAYATPGDDRAPEFCEIVVETDTMPIDDWKRCFLFAWAVQCFHCLNLTQCLAVFAHVELGLPYNRFYERLLEFAASHPETLIGQQYRFASEMMHRGLQGKSMEVTLPKFGQLAWFLEEASFLNLVGNKQQVYGELKDFLSDLLDTTEPSLEEDLVADLVEYQKAVLVDPFTSPDITVELKHDLPDYFGRIFLGDRQRLEKSARRVVLRSDRDYRGVLDVYALEVVRYGRKRNKLHRKACREEDLPDGQRSSRHLGSAAS